MSEQGHWPAAAVRDRGHGETCPAQTAQAGWALITSSIPATALQWEFQDFQCLARGPLCRSHEHFPLPSSLHAPSPLNPYVCARIPLSSLSFPQRQHLAAASRRWHRTLHGCPWAECEEPWSCPEWGPAAAQPDTAVDLLVASRPASKTLPENILGSFWGLIIPGHFLPRCRSKSQIQD